MITYGDLLEAVDDGHLVIIVVDTVITLGSSFTAPDPSNMRCARCAAVIGVVKLDERARSFAHHEDDAVKIGQMISAMRVVREHGNFHPV